MSQVSQDDLLFERIQDTTGLGMLLIRVFANAAPWLVFTAFIRAIQGERIGPLELFATLLGGLITLFSNDSNPSSEQNE